MPRTILKIITNTSLQPLLKGKRDANSLGNNISQEIRSPKIKLGINSREPLSIVLKILVDSLNRRPYGGRDKGSSRRASIEEMKLKKRIHKVKAAANFPSNSTKQSLIKARKSF